MSDSPTSAFHDFEKAGWEQAAVDYDDAFARVTAQSVAPMLDALRTGPGVRLLDVACGPGYVAGQAAARGADVLGIDFSTAMVALARQRHPHIEFREGDAQALELPDASFDALAMNFGLLHLDQPERALAEAARVLKPGGRCAFTVWVAPPRNAVFRIVLGAIERYGRMDTGLPPGPPFFRYSDPAVARQSLGKAGLQDIEVTEVAKRWRFESPDQFFEAMVRGTVRTGALLRAQTPAALQRIRAAITEEAGAFADADGVAIPMPSVLMSGRKA